MKAIFQTFCLFFCILGSSCFQLLLAQEPVYIHYTVEDGLPSNTVYYSMQDSDGYLWIATDKGVVRFDGVQFKVYTTAEGLADNECFDIYEDQQHRIWFASYNGEPCFFQHGIFHNKSNTEFLSKIPFTGPALKIMQDNKGDLFYLTFKNMYRLRGQKFERLNLKASLFSSLIKTDLGDVYAISSNVKHKCEFINLSKNNKKSFEQYYDLIQINTKACYNEGSIYFHDNGNLFSYNLKTERIKLIYSYGEPQSIQCIAAINNKISVGTNYGFISDIKPASKVFFEEKSISSIYQDSEKNKWISTLNDGIFQIINSDVVCYNRSSGLGFDNCHSINLLENGMLGIGSNDFHYAIFNDKNVFHAKLPAHNGTGIIKRIQMHDNHYYLCTGGSFIQLDHVFRLKKEMINTVKDFYIDNENKLFVIGGNDLYVNPLPKMLSVKNLRPKTQDFSVAIKASGIYLTPKKECFVYGLFGVRKLEKGKLIQPHPSEFLSKNILNVYSDKQGVIWMASSVYGLLALYEDQVYRFDQDSGLPSHYVTSISKGKDKQLWIGTNKGLCKIHYTFVNKKLVISCKNYDRSCGLPSDMINDVLYKNDTIWAATSMGLCVFNAVTLSIKKTHPKLVLTEFYANEIKQQIKNNIVLSPDFRRIKINFNGISFFSLGKIKYKHKLSGLQSEWNYSPSNQIEYPSLNAGKYHLQIMAIDAFGNASEIREIRFEISPHFYESWWFIVLTIFIFLALSFIVVYYRIRKIKLNHKLKQHVLYLEHEKLKIEHKETKLLKEFFELEQKALQLQMNPHFIFNSINTIQGLYKKDKTKGDEYLIKFSKLLRQILEFSKSKIIGLNQEITFLQNYLDLNKLRFEKAFEYEIEVNDEIQTNQIGISTMIIQPFVENALLHGIQSLLDKGRIKLYFYLKDELLICEITDNGIGREKSKERNKNRIQKSLGLEITEKRLKIFNKEVQQKALEIIDLYDETGMPCGTKVVVAMLFEEI